MAGLSCDDSTNVGTPVQPQLQAMGAARRDPRRGESPVTRSQAWFPSLPVPGEVVSNTGKALLKSNSRREPPCCFAKSQIAGMLFVHPVWDIFNTAKAKKIITVFGGNPDSLCLLESY